MMEPSDPAASGKPAASLLLLAQFGSVREVKAFLKLHGLGARDVDAALGLAVSAGQAQACAALAPSASPRGVGDALVGALGARESDLACLEILAPFSSPGHAASALILAASTAPLKALELLLTVRGPYPLDASLRAAARANRPDVLALLLGCQDQPPSVEEALTTAASADALAAFCFLLPLAPSGVKLFHLLMGCACNGRSSMALAILSRPDAPPPKLVLRCARQAQDLGHVQTSSALAGWVNAQTDDNILREAALAPSPAPKKPFL
jgi:hypothetical protein